MPFDPSRLLTQLQNTGLQNKDNPLFQLLRSLIGSVSQLTTAAASASGSSGSGTTIVHNETINNIVSMLDDDSDSESEDEIIAPFAISTSIGGLPKDIQFNNNGQLGGSVLKQTSTDLIDQKRGANAQEHRFYKDDSGATFERLTTISSILDFFNEVCFTFLTEASGGGATNGIQLRSAGSISLSIPGAFPTLMIYHDPTSNGGISLIPNGSTFIGHIFCDQSSSFMETAGGFAVPHMLDLLLNSIKAYIIGSGPSGADFTKRFLTFDETNGRIEVGQNPASGFTGGSRGFVFDSATGGLVANLPAAGPTGSVMYVTNALAPAVGVAVAGGGAAFALVCYNGAAWNVIGV
jgi:hypothetical protein